MGEPVLADAQFGMVKILRPFSGFEAVYEGNSVATPIMFTELGQPLDPLAGTPGYSPKLLKGLSVPMGSRVKIWIPMVFAASLQPLFQESYSWFCEWRLRNTFDFRQRRIPFHLAKQGAGVPDTTSTTSPDRVVIPAAFQPVIYNQPESPLVTQHIDVEALSPTGMPIPLPLLPDGTNGVVQQGLLDPGSILFGTLASMPLFVPFEYQALGDELLIGVFRGFGTPAQPNWEFTTPPQVDQILSLLFGKGSGKEFPDIGVYVMTGSAP